MAARKKTVFGSFTSKLPLLISQNAEQCKKEIRGIVQTFVRDKKTYNAQLFSVVFLQSGL